MIADRFYYSMMSTREKGIYNELYKAILELKPQVRVSGFVDIDTVGKIASAITCDNPHLFYFKQTYISVHTSVRGSIIKPEYFFTRKEIDTLNLKIETAVNTIIRKLQLNDAHDDYEKEKRIHDLLAKQVSYDHDALAAKADTKRLVTAHSIVGVFILKKAVCEGIAKATKILLNTANIKCIVATGKAKLESTEEGHAWNIVKINGAPYHLDATWDIANTAKSSIDYDYFNLTDEQIAIDHSDFHDLPICTAKKDNFFSKNGLEFSDLAQLKAHISRQVNGGQRQIAFKWIGKAPVSRVNKPIVQYCLLKASLNGYRWSANYRINDGQKTCYIDLAERA